jgi:HAD superfamily hydrolase (TIGR01490 family)
MSNQKAKEMILRYFFGRNEVEKFQQRCDEFAAESLSRLVRPKALLEIEKLKAAGAEVVIVSASAGNWISSWCTALGVTLIATQLEERSGRITGRISGKNCHGEEKVRRIREKYDLSAYDEIYCYGDTKGDRPMLGLATFSFYAPFR